MQENKQDITEICLPCQNGSECTKCLQPTSVSSFKVILQGFQNLPVKIQEDGKLS